MDNNVPDRRNGSTKSALTEEESALFSTLFNNKEADLGITKRLRRFYRRQVNRVWNLVLCGEGFSLKGARFWIRRCRSDWNQKLYSRRDIRRAHREGFSAAQIDRYGITPQNIDTFISERSFDYLQPINGKYNKWFADRVTTRMIAGHKFSHLFEPIHFNVISRFGELLFIPLSDEAKRFTTECGDAEQAFFKLIDEWDDEGGALRLAGSAWRSSIGFRISPIPAGTARHGSHAYLVGDVEVSRAFVRSYLVQRSAKTPLVLYRPLLNDESIFDFGDSFSSGVRMLFYNPMGTPLLSNAFVRLRYRSVSDVDDVDEEPEGERPAIEEEDEPNAGETPSDRVVRTCSLPIDTATGAFSGGRALLTDRSYADAAEFFDAYFLQGSVPHWEDITREITAFLKTVPQIELLEVAVRVSSGGFRIVGVKPSPSYNYAYPFSPELAAFLKGKVKDKREGKVSSVKLVNKAAFRRSRRAFTKTLYPAGMVFYQGLRYPHDVIEDLFCSNGIPLKRKIWGYTHGFLSYRMDLYPELCKDNWQNYMTDFEYRWLRHINPKYRNWMEDKLTIKYLLADFNEFLPGYYFFTSCRAGENRVIPLMDSPEGVEASIEGILSLVREQGIMAFKPDEGSHGEGFYKVTYSTEEGFALNGEPATEERVADILREPGNQYLVSEYIELHPDLKKIYPGSVNTVRITVFKRDGVIPQVGNAYLRIGSERSGAVDNVVAGGFVAEVDVETGRFGDARTLVNNRLVHEKVHPDTGVPMEGRLPHWDFVKDAVLRMAQAVPQLEYMGFDVAITEEGLKLLEVNRYPDYPRISRLTPATTEYLLDRVAQKKRFVHIDTDKSLFKLPRRDA